VSGWLAVTSVPSAGLTYTPAATAVSTTHPRTTSAPKLKPSGCGIKKPRTTATISSHPPGQPHASQLLPPRKTPRRSSTPYSVRKRFELDSFPLSRARGRGWPAAGASFSRSGPGEIFFTRPFTYGPFPCGWRFSVPPPPLGAGRGAGLALR
jgi:hypothetical protein